MDTELPVTRSTPVSALPPDLTIAEVVVWSGLSDTTVRRIVRAMPHGVIADPSAGGRMRVVREPLIEAVAAYHETVRAGRGPRPVTGPWLGTTAAARRVGMTPGGIRAAVRAGRLPGEEVETTPGRVALRVHVDALNRYALDHRR